MATSDGPPRTVFGPYYRKWAEDKQDAKTIVNQLLTGELWGKAARFSSEPAAKAYRGVLPEGEEGFEFWAFAPPDNAIGTRVYWSKLGEFLTFDGKLEQVALKIAFVRITQSLHQHA